MLIRDILPLSLSFWPFLFGHCFFTSFLLLFQFTQGELQKSCSRAIAEKVSESCQLACQCRPYPPLPPPPPPPPPPRLLVSTVTGPTVPQMKPWWKEIVVLGTVGCASVAFLLLTVIICYKAIKRSCPEAVTGATPRSSPPGAARSPCILTADTTLPCSRSAVL
ncbi:proline-rich membrane anchor 1-like isoform X2 [Conger conger]|uniref:proline-rich membrane anchor 1-like isoform X2 n=1 Tax=Conger conger TaxID=82655 RepID=UPI002A5A74C7|nr:proline-rich membrane anchor 1-like isoform X2 [Conger conger]